MPFIVNFYFTGESLLMFSTAELLPRAGGLEEASAKLTVGTIIAQGNPIDLSMVKMHYSNIIN